MAATTFGDDGRRGAGVRVVLVVVLVAAACGAADPYRAVLEERARWQVQTLSFADGAGGGLIVNVRIAGPVRSQLERLTVRLVLQDAAGREVGSQWRTLDLSGIRRGTPTDTTLLVEPGAAGGAEVAGVGIDLVHSPTPEQAQRMPELAAVARGPGGG